MSTGADLIRLERLRQQEVEGFSIERDAGYAGGELNYAAQAYCQEALEPGTWPAQVDGEVAGPPTWPWGSGTWKPAQDPIGNLVKAGALIAAELDRLLVARSSA